MSLDKINIKVLFDIFLHCPAKIDVLGWTPVMYRICNVADVKLLT